MAEKKIYINLLLDPEFIDFLEYMKQENGIVKARIVALSVMKKYENEYKAFIDKRSKGAE